MSLHPTWPCDRHHPSPRGKRKGPRRRSQAQPSPILRRLAMEPSRTAEMNDQSRNVTWNQRHPGLRMSLAAPSPRPARLVPRLSRTAETNQPEEPRTYNPSPRYPAWIPRSLEAETPRPLTACRTTLPSQPGLPVAKSELLHCIFVVACNLPVYSAPPTKEFGIFRLGISARGCFGPERRVSAKKKRPKRANEAII